VTLIIKLNVIFSYNTPSFSIIEIDSVLCLTFLLTYPTLFLFCLFVIEVGVHINNLRLENINSKFEQDLIHVKSFL
jgi:hypothetical protein